MLESYLQKLNARKENNAPYQDLLDIMESSIDSYTLYDKVQALYLLVKEYNNINTSKTLELIELALVAIGECFEKNILYKDDYHQFCDIYTELFAIKIRVTKNYELLKLQDKYIFESPDKLFYLCLEIFAKDKNIKYLVYALKFTRAGTIKAVFDCYVSKNAYNKGFIDAFTKIDILDGYRYYYEIFINYDKTLIEKIIGCIVSRNDGYSDLNLVYANAIITNKKSIYCEIINEMTKILPCTEPSFAYYTMLASKDAKSTIIYEDTETGNIVNNELVQYLLCCKEYSRVLDCKIDLDTRIHCMLKLNMIEEAKKLYETYLQKKYSIVQESNIDFLSPVTKFVLNLKLKDRIGCLNILQEIDKPYMLIKCLRKAYKAGDLMVVKEGIQIGITKFGSKDINMIKVLVSFLHIKELGIEVKERIGVMVGILDNITVKNMFDKDKEWFYDVCYNNCIDSINSKYNEFWRLITFCILFMGVTNEVIYLCLNAIINRVEKTSYKISRADFGSFERYNSDILLIEALCKSKDTQKIAKILLNYYIGMSRRTTNIDLLFYTVLDNDETKNLIIAKNLTNKALLKAMNINTKDIRFRIDLIKEAEKRCILESNHASKIVASVSLRGSHELYELLQSIDLSKYYNNYIEDIITKQIELLKLVNNRFLLVKFEELMLKHAK